MVPAKNNLERHIQNKNWWILSFFTPGVNFIFTQGGENNFTLNVFNLNIQLTIGDSDDWSRSLHFRAIFIPVFGLENCTEELAKMQWIVHYITHHQLQFFSYRRTKSDEKWPRCPSNEVTFVSKVISWLQMRFFFWPSIFASLEKISKFSR